MKKLKYLLIFLMVFVMICSIGCFVVPEEPEEPEEPILVLSAEVYGVEISDDGNHGDVVVCCHIKNTGDVDISLYKLTFDVDLYGHVNLKLTASGEDLKVGAVTKECVEVFCPVCESEIYIVESVNVTYELWE